MTSFAERLATKDESSVDVDFAVGSYKKECFYFITRGLFLLGTNKEKPSINVMVDNKPIESSPGMKLLGVKLDDNLNYKLHTSGIC